MHARATRVDGYVDASFAPVADAFRANFADGLEVGAACAVYVDGRLVVDLWGGVADPRVGRPWTDETSTVVFSVTKGLLAILAHRAVEAGLLDLDAPVARYWPEFAQAGKADIPVRWLLSHRAGLLAPDRDLTLDEALAWTPVVDALAAQAPLWEPGTAWEYHCLTFGWLVGEVLRRITGRSPGRLLREQISEPLGADVWLGVTAAQAARMARKVPAVEPPVVDRPDVLDRARTLGSAFVGAAGIDEGFNAPRIHAAEVPGAGGIGTARGLAKAFASTVSEICGLRPLSADSLRTVVQVESESPSWTGEESPVGRFSTGFELDCEAAQMLGPASFGHSGTCGSLGFADADHRVGFGYVANQMRGAEDPRSRRLVTAVSACLDRTSNAAV